MRSRAKTMYISNPSLEYEDRGGHMLRIWPSSLIYELQLMCGKMGRYKLPSERS